MLLACPNHALTSEGGRLRARASPHVCTRPQIIEVFGAGTAAIVSPVKAIFYNGEVRQRGELDLVGAQIVSDPEGEGLRGSTGAHDTFCQDLAIPLDPKNPANQAGPTTKRFADTIMAIQVRALTAWPRAKPARQVLTPAGALGCGGGAWRGARGGGRAQYGEQPSEWSVVV